jgi:transcription termination factor Rho
MEDVRKQNAEYKKLRETKYKADSKDRLSKILKKKIQTTMIGALSTIEENFGFLWNSPDGTLTKEQEVMKNLYNQVRSDILDKGNNQARNIDAELAQYDVEWLRYSIKMPIVTPPNN